MIAKRLQALLSAGVPVLLILLSGEALALGRSVPAVPPTPAEAPTLKVLSLNVWVLKVLTRSIGKDIDARMKIIPDAVAATGADVIAFQELWPDRYKKRLGKALKERGYPYIAFRPKPLFNLGNGLVIVSRYPITEFKVAPLYTTHTRNDEILATKRAVYAEIQLPSGERIDFFTSHLGALSYRKKEGTYHAGQRRRQLEQFSELKTWIQQQRRNSRMIFAGDMNANYLTLEGGRFKPQYDVGYLRFLSQGCGSREDFLNTFLTANRKDQYSREEPTYSTDNPYVAGGHFADAPSETEDYIFSCGFAPEAIRRSSVEFRDPVRAEDYPGVKLKKVPARISDHYGLFTEFAL